MESGTYKPYAAPCIEVVDVVLESTVLEPSLTSCDSDITGLEEDNPFVW